MINLTIKKSIEEASQVVGKTWPLYSFVTSNPLSGYERMPFEKAVNQARKFLNANVFPESTLFRQAWEKGEIDEKVLLKLLGENQLLESPEYYLQQMASHKKRDAKNSHHDLDRIMAKWLAAFMDEGLAEWEMPNKSDGFYSAWRKLAVNDNDMPKMAIGDIPKTKTEALDILMNGYSSADFTKIFTWHLAALPGWTGYINHRTTYHSEWQQEYPITLEDYLAVRLWVAREIDAEIYPEDNDTSTISSLSKLQYIWLKAWEKSWQKELVKVLDSKQISTPTTEKKERVPDAQMVFCIDTRSELIRRHVENKGHYETFGYAGFFGIAMDYEDLKDGLIRKSCPPILNSAYHVSEVPQEGHTEKVQAYKQKNAVSNFKEYFLKRMKNMLPSAFGYVEGAGLFYGMSLIARTLVPGHLYWFNKNNTTAYESICEPQIGNTDAAEKTHLDIPLAEKVAIVKGAFDLMGWEKLAPLVLFIGHGSHSANNPFGSSLDCGACAASPGRHNARMLATIANILEVQQALKENHNIEIPASTIFIGGEHNTTTDEILLFVSEI
ncbi:MAG: Na-translocating system protein MpsB, partial [Flavobacterium sp.]